MDVSRSYGLGSTPSSSFVFGMERPRRQKDGEGDLPSQARASFRQPAPAFVSSGSLRDSVGKLPAHFTSDDTEPSVDASTGAGAPLPPIDTTDSEPQDRQMFFYYPKYLDPDAVVLISRTLLQQWEAEESSKRHQQ